MIFLTIFFRFSIFLFFPAYSIEEELRKVDEVLDEVFDDALMKLVIKLVMNSS